MLIQAPVLNTIPSRVAGGKSKHVISFSYEFSNDDPQTIFVAGSSIIGTSYSLNLSQLFNTALPPMRSMQVTCQFQSGFDNSGNYMTDSPLYIVASSGQIQQLAPNSLSPSPSPAATELPLTNVVSAVLPLAASAGGSITFIKGTPVSTSIVYGTLTVSLFDFKLQPYVASGISQI